MFCKGYGKINQTKIETQRIQNIPRFLDGSKISDQFFWQCIKTWQNIIIKEIVMLFFFSCLHSPHPTSLVCKSTRKTKWAYFRVEWLNDCKHSIVFNSVMYWCLRFFLSRFLYEFMVFLGFRSRQPHTIVSAVVSTHQLLRFFEKLNSNYKVDVHFQMHLWYHLVKHLQIC